MRDQKPEGTFPRTKRLESISDHSFSRHRLQVSVAGARHRLHGLLKLTLTPSAPITKSPENVAPLSRVTVASETLTSTTELDVCRIAGVPAPSMAVACFLSSSCSPTRCERTQGCGISYQIKRSVYSVISVGDLHAAR